MLCPFRCKDLQELRLSPSWAPAAFVAFWSLVLQHSKAIIKNGNINSASPGD